MKRCHGCGRDLPKSDFHRGQNKDGLQSRCKTCMRAAKTRWLAGGVDRLSLADRFWANVDYQDTLFACWVWTAGRTPAGYGVFRPHRVQTTAHRVAWELTYGSIPDGMEIDHLCRNRACVNPAHLEPVTHAENCRRRDAS